MEPHPATEELVNTLRNALAGREDIWLVLLFGSQARGRARAGSDVDLAVDAPGVDLSRLSAELSLAARREVHLANLWGAGYPLKQALLRDAILVHQGAKGAAARWRYRTLLEVTDEREWYERMQRAYLRRLAAEGFRRG
ncbi:MAG: nucleotidyltransferase domain-containing protein [Myxococcales bacterium]|nr:nucleotidyltransferase domain-containing protein [Myxococcales bacterium]